ncbi:MAG: 4a-hydroxytetrahydrobiopterin dehydratase [Thermoleophilia bacterium]
MAGTIGDAEVRGRLTGDLARWELRDGSLVRTYRTGGWKASLMVAGAVAHLAEAAWHHPDLLVTYPSVEVRLVSHDAGGITERDLSLALRIEHLVTWRPTTADGPFSGTPDDPRFAYVLPDED